MAIAMNDLIMLLSGASCWSGLGEVMVFRVMRAVDAPGETSAAQQAGFVI
jgi:hypothetical protein